MNNQKISECIEKIFNINTNSYIFIYTPPKVGSTTLVSSLRISLGKSFNIIHIHDEVMLSVLSGIDNITINEIINFLSQQGKNVYVIDVYRTPIERKMSEFFEKISPYHFNNSESNINKYSIKRVSDRFNKLFPHLENGDHYFEKFNIENPVPFDFTNKYTIQVINNIKYIKIRLCDSQLWDNILSKVLNTDIVLITDYSTDKKEIGDLYKRFKKEYKLPKNYFDIIKSCKFLNFYYNEEERNVYLNYWENKLCDVFYPYSVYEYNFYMNICLENQYINDIQLEHYVDNGCFCSCCSKKRREIFMKAKSGEKNFERIIHNHVINEEISNRNKKIQTIIEHNLKTIQNNSVKNQFKIKLK